MANHRRRARIRGGEVEMFTELEIFERDDWICGICHEPIDSTLPSLDPMSASIDHILAIVNGGNHTRVNVQAAHLRCNISKGSR
jgi:5-methylcytosine-specific restriction endonuclease McrA